jgi:hypothetical protein
MRLKQHKQQMVWKFAIKEFELIFRIHNDHIHQLQDSIVVIEDVIDHLNAIHQGVTDQEVVTDLSVNSEITEIGTGTEITKDEEVQIDLTIVRPIEEIDHQCVKDVVNVIEVKFAVAH